MASVGQRFSTGNAVVATLPVGAVLEVSGSGQLEIVELPVREFQPGDRVEVLNKGRVGTIVRMTTRDDLHEELPYEGQQLYVSDDAPYVIRTAAEENLRHV